MLSVAANIFVGALLLGLAALALRSLWKSKKRGGCAGCSGGGCHGCRPASADKDS